MTAASRATTIPPVDALDPIATPEPGDCPIYDALATGEGEGTAIGGNVLMPRRDSRGRFCKPTTDHKNRNHR